jgi:hypothetical protein
MHEHTKEVEKFYTVNAMTTTIGAESIVHAIYHFPENYFVIDHRTESLLASNLQKYLQIICRIIFQKLKCLLRLTRIHLTTD